MVRTMLAKSMMSYARMAAGRKLRAAAVTLVRPPPLTQRSRALSHLREGVGGLVALQSRVDAAGFRRLLASSAQGASQRESTIDVLYDGECPLCMHEVTWLSKRNKRRGDVSMTFTDISLPDYDPSAHAGVSYEEGMKVMHVIKDGRVYKGVESFQVMYEAVGLGFVLAALSSPAVKIMADRLYDVWARLRLPLSGRPSLEVLLERRSIEDASCAGKDRCTVKDANDASSQ